jgi:hypothetical protein
VSASSWERRGGVAGIVGVAIDLAGVVIGGRGIAIDSEPQALVGRYVELGVRPAVHALCIATAMVLLLWFASSLRSVLVRAEGDGPLTSVFFGAALSVFAIEFVRATVLVTLSLRAGDLGPDVVAGLYVITQVIGPVSAVPLAAGLLALAVLVRDTGRLPQWIAPWCTVVAAVWLISTVRALTTSTAVWSASIAAFIAYGAGVVAIGLALARGRLTEGVAVQQ